MIDAPLAGALGGGLRDDGGASRLRERPQNGDRARFQKNRPAEGQTLLFNIGNLLEDVGLMMLAVLLFPLGILLIGAPIAACVRALVAIGHRL